MRGVWLMLGVLVATPVMAADQFDLICKAKKTEVRYRVDLKSGEYCTGECAIVRKIAEVTSGMLSFQKADPQVGADARITDQVNRVTGEWYRSAFFPGIDVVPSVKVGTCQPATFGGMPASRF
jgi:hypothetical protein